MTKRYCERKIGPLSSYDWLFAVGGLCHVEYNGLRPGSRRLAMASVPQKPRLFTVFLCDEFQSFVSNDCCLLWLSRLYAFAILLCWVCYLRRCLLKAVTRRHSSVWLWRKIAVADRYRCSPLYNRRSVAKLQSVTQYFSYFQLSTNTSSSFDMPWKSLFLLLIEL